ncbi:thiolase family protein [Janibacter corallicola]|uniref:thiolase family protein n=1 Tax=Janibacter corallicola TaxID=415212 RepID=UPI000830C42E|nr:thiolase family protein [Janibacter corallicola]
MKLPDVAVPAGMVWSSPFAKWQGSLGGVSSLDVAAAVTSRALADRGLAPERLTGLVLGWSVPQPEIFYGTPLLAARIGAEGLTGPMVSQACATSVAALQAAATTTADGDVRLVVATDRTSNGPTLVYPDPNGQGGAPTSTHWVLDSFSRDPWAGSSMIAAGDLVGREGGFTRQQADELKVLRHEQYTSALAEGRAFQRRYMVPVEVGSGRRAVTLEADEGIRPVDPESIAGLRTVDPEGIHTFATQTHPADGCAGAVVATTEAARELSGGEGVVRLLATGTARVGRSRMPEAPVPAAREALADAGLTMEDVDLVTTHNPFAVNDLYFSRETGYPLERMNVRGSSLVFGHPQGPTGLRSIAELVEELRLRGGGTGLFTGCAAGDSGMALVVRVED